MTASLSISLLCHLQGTSSNTNGNVNNLLVFLHRGLTNICYNNIGLSRTLKDWKIVSINVNDTIRMYKKWKIKMYNCVHSYIHFNAFFFDTINSRNGGEKNSKFERSKNMFGNVRFKT